MPCFLCVACGSQFAECAEPPRSCPICCDDRQFIPEAGQQWVDYAAVRSGYRIAWSDEAPGVSALVMDLKFGIAQRAFLVKASEGYVLWDCLSIVDDAAIAEIAAGGGLSAVAISHPHYYGAMVEWGRALGCPVYLHEGDAEWVQRPDPVLRLWSGERLALDCGAMLIRCGGHFPGGTVMHVPAMQTGDGDRAAMLLTGDVIQVAQDRAHVSFMYSYPNMIPLDAPAVRRIAAAVAGLDFDMLLGAFPGRTIKTGARAAVDRSVARYLRAIGAPVN